METHAKCTRFEPALGNVLAVLMAGYFAALITGCAPQITEPPPTAPGAPPPTIAKAAEPITVEMTQAGKIVRATDANGAALPTQGYPSEREKHYFFRSGVIASPGNPSVQVPAVCLWKDKDPKRFCWPNDRPARIQLRNGEILNVQYQLDNGTSAYAGPLKRDVVQPFAEEACPQQCQVVTPYMVMCCCPCVGL